MKRIVAIAIMLLMSLAIFIPLSAAQSSSGGVKVNPLREAYYGDLHLHTALSLDAYIANGARVMPGDAYRFARGETIDYFGLQVRRQWPLDFMAVTDHAEHLGIMN